MRLRACIAAIAVITAGSAMAEENNAATFSGVVARLAAPEVLRGSFQQTRTLRLIDKPLESTGRFLLSDLGLYWQQEKPVASVLVVDEERLLQSVAGGPMQDVDVARNPAVMSFSQSFLSIFRGDEGVLRNNFDVAFTPGENQTWTIELRPTSYPMAEAIESITLDGRDQIEQLRVLSRTSEETVIRFTDLVSEPGRLTEHEIELYAR